MRVRRTMADPQMAVAQQPRLVKAAHEFEAQMMKELLKPMTKGGTLEGDADSSSGNALEDFAAEALGQGISSRGGLGIADEIIRSLSRDGTNQSNLERPGVNSRVGERRTQVKSGFADEQGKEECEWKSEIVRRR